MVSYSVTKFMGLDQDTVAFKEMRCLPFVVHRLSSCL